jgi:hypothetical protein
MAGFGRSYRARKWNAAPFKAARTYVRPRTARAKTRGFAASPAGRHRTLAMKCFALATRARAVGNTRHARAMLAMGRRALALSKAELRLWKRGLALARRSFATHRALVAAR